jgi:hypothetical protein
VLTAGLASISADASVTLQKIMHMRGVVSLHLLATDPGKTAVQTNERNLRTSDQSFAGWLVIEAEDRNALTELLPAISGIADLADENSVGGPYRQVFSR